MTMEKQEILSPHIPVRPDWLASTGEEVVEPDLPIVDAHHHLWDLPGRRYLLPDYLADIGSGHNVRSTVFIECKAMYRQARPAAMRPVGETEFANGAAAMAASGLYGHSRVCAGIVGFADLAMGDAVAPVLEAHIVAGGGRFRGIRNISAWHGDPSVKGSVATPPRGLLTGQQWREGFRHLARLELSFDAFMYQSQLGEVVDLARAFPETAIVVDHCGGLLGIGPYAERRSASIGEWYDGIAALASCTNVFLKLGGLGMRMTGFDFHQRALAPSSTELAEAWRPYVETCIGRLGVDRCMFESNFPVDKGMFGYRVLWNAFKRLTRAYSTAERAALFEKTARSVYRLPENE